MSPWKLQPNALETDASRTGIPNSLKRSISPCVCARCCSGVRLMLRFMNASEGYTRTLPSRVSRPEARARSRPWSLNHSAVYSRPGLIAMRPAMSSAPAIPGTCFGLTKDATWMRCTPVSESASISATLRSVAIGPLSIWKPSRGPSSVISTLDGRSDTGLPLHRMEIASAGLDQRFKRSEHTNAGGGEAAGLRRQRAGVAMHQCSGVTHGNAFLSLASGDQGIDRLAEAER